MFLAHVLYWTMPAAVLLWLVAMWRGIAAAGGLRIGLRLERGALVRAAVAAVMVGLVAIALPPAMRMQFDDTSIAGVAQNMHEHRIAMMSMSGVPSPDGALQVLDWNLDKRPPLVPFLVSVLHDLTGYRVQNVFALNLVLLWLLLVGVAGLVARLGASGPAAWASMAGVWAMPLLWHVGTGGGLELAATLLMLWVAWQARETVRDPRPARVAQFATSAAACCWTRYESVVVVALLTVALAIVVRGRLVARGTWWAWGGCAAVLAPLPFLLLHGQEAGFYLEAGDERRVALDHVVDHVPELLAALLAPTWSNPMPGVLTWLALLAMCLRLRQRPSATTSTGLRWLVVPPIAHAALVSAWFYADVAEPTALRLYLPIAVLAAACAGLAFAPLRTRSQTAASALPSAALAAGLAVLAMTRLATLPSTGVLPPSLAVRSLAALDAALAKVPFDPHHTVVVTTAAQYLLIQGTPAVPPRALPQRGVGAATQVLFVTTALDEQLAPWFGDPRPLIDGYRATLVAEVTGEQPARVYRVAK